MNVTISYILDEKGRLHLPSCQFPAKSNEPRVNLKLVLNQPSTQISMIPKTYPIFQQAAYCYNDYGDYNEYMKHHGCACCSLTTLLATFSSECRDLTPDQTITRVEKNLFPTTEWQGNYGKKMKKQMPVTLYGISKILEAHNISNHYIREFTDEAAWFVIRAHLEKGRPVVVETSKIRYKNRKIRSVTDKKYAGSYHTMILLGMEEDRETVWFTDSAFRAWSGDAQRIKREKLSDLINYMFPCKYPGAENVYFTRRAETGGYILID